MGDRAPSTAAKARTVRSGSPHEENGCRGDAGRVLACALDREGRVVEARGAWDVVLGWPAERLAGETFTDLLSPDDRLRAGGALHRVLHDLEAAVSVSARMRTADGADRAIVWGVTASGTDGLMHLIGSDVEPGTVELTHLRRRVAQLEAQEAELRVTTGSLQRFSSVAAHELADPLIIVERSAILLEEELGEELNPFLRSRLHSLRRVAARGRLLLESLLKDAMSAERTPDLELVDVATVVDDALTMVADPGTRVPPRIKVGWMPTITTNAELLGIVLRNLIANAVKYASPAAGAIVVDAERETAGWRLWVRSPGDAISPEESERILRRFERGANGAGIGGAGLGLAICSRIIGRLGGTLGLIPEPGVGNRFFVSLPDPAQAG